MTQDLWMQRALTAEKVADRLKAERDNLLDNWNQWLTEKAALQEQRDVLRAALEDIARIPNARRGTPLGFAKQLARDALASLPSHPQAEVRCATCEHPKGDHINPAIDYGLPTSGDRCLASSLCLCRRFVPQAEASREET